MKSLFQKNPQSKPVSEPTPVVVKQTVPATTALGYEEFKSFDINNAAEKLMAYNGLESFEAKEILLGASYNRKASRRHFVSRLESDRDLGLETLKVKFDLSYLSNSGFLNHEAAKEFKKKIGNLHQVELEFEVYSPEVAIDPLLEEKQLIKLAPTPELNK